MLVVGGGVALTITYHSQPGQLFAVSVASLNEEEIVAEQVCVESVAVKTYCPDWEMANAAVAGSC
jgi:hypothetical protein